MFAYLSKKLEMSSGANVKCLAWSPTNNYLACGCDNGLLKVLKIDTYKSPQPEDEAGSNGTSSSVGYLASPSNILLNQTLEGHSCPIQVIAWNNVYNKLTTSDSRGLIVVWMLYKGSWYEEMVNNRNKSTVRGLAWSSDGEKISIVYEDGGVIVGSSDGNRLWSKELRGPQLTGVCWSPNSSFLLFSLSTGEVHIYDGEGTYVTKLALDSGRSDGEGDAITIVRWHSSEEAQNASHTLAVVFRENVLYLFNGIYDACPMVVSTGLLATCGEWSPNGNFLAIGGSPFHSSGDSLAKARIFGPNGNVLYDLSLPQKGIVDLAWDSWNLRLAIGMGANVFFANIRPFYKTCFYGEYMYLYVYTKSSGTQLAFWDQEKVTLQEIPGKVVELKGNREVCAILTESNQSCTIAITNVLGNAIDSIKMESIQPFTIALTESLVVAVAKNGVMLWRYHKGAGILPVKVEHGSHREKIFHIDDESTAAGPDVPGQTLKATKDPCICADAKENVLVIGRDSGALNVYSLPHATLLHVMSTSEGFAPARRIFLNMDGTQLAMLDSNGSLSTCNLGMQSGAFVKQYEKKDIWDLLWARDNPNLLCIMEKTRLYIIINGEIQDPIVSSGYLMNFVDLEVTTILLDELMRDPESPSSQLIVKYEARSLRDTQALLSSDTSLEDIFKYVEDNSHPILWQMLARKALYTLNFKVAETSFVRCRDYGGVQFTKRVAAQNKPQIQLAEISAYYNDFRSAESYYRQCGRKDLIMDMWTLLGKWQYVDIESIREAHSEFSEETMRSIYGEIGDAFAEDGDWVSAKPFYEISNQHRKMYECSLILEDYVGLGNLIPQLPEGSDLFEKIGNVLSSVGLCEMAVFAYVSGRMHNEAVECCILLNRWNLAMELAQDYNLPSTGRVTVMYAAHLVSQDEIMQAIDLFRTSCRPFYGAVIAVMLALKFLESEDFNVVLVRKLFSLAAVLVKPSFHLIPEQLQPQASFDELFEFYMPPELVPPVDVVDWIQCDPWRGVNAINCFIAVQRKIYTKEYREAIRRGVYLLEYVDILGEERVGCIIGLTAANWEAFHVASQAFMLLEAFDPSYAKISSQLFSDLDPVDLVDIHLDAPQAQDDD